MEESGDEERLLRIGVQCGDGGDRGEAGARDGRHVRAGQDSRCL